MNTELPCGHTVKSDNGEYQIIKTIGKGSVCTVYLAMYTGKEISSKCILKEYTPADIEISRDTSGFICCPEKYKSEFQTGMERFTDSVKKQNTIRQLSFLNNQTPPVMSIFKAGNTVYAAVSCYNGTTLSTLKNLTLQQITEICITIARTTGYYHSAGYICLDLKPDNIFILQNSPEDTVTQIAEFIDFGGIRETNSYEFTLEYTNGWAAPEQLSYSSAEKTNKSADIYTIGEIIFYLIFGRHSDENEHRAFSVYPFEKCRPEYRKLISRPDIRTMFTEIFRNTLRSSEANRFENTDHIVTILEKILCEIRKKDFVIPLLPSVSPNFTGRENELNEISKNLEQNRVLFINGIGGIGKSSLVRNFIVQNKSGYDVLIYLEYEENIIKTFTDDMQLQISTVRRYSSESPEEYFTRKLSALKQICAEKRVLVSIDNFSGKTTRELTQIINCGYDTVIVSRQQPPKNSYQYMNIGPLSEKSDILKLITLNLERHPSEEEIKYFDEICELIQGHTLVLELIARQISAGRINIRNAVTAIRKNGFLNFSDSRISNLKDGEEIYDTLSVIITSLFNAGKLSREYITVLKIMSLADSRGLEPELIQDILKLPDMSVLTALEKEGWINSDRRIRVHPVISETACSWKWPEEISDKEVMYYHEKMTDIYEGNCSHEQIYRILCSAEKYISEHPRHFTRAIYFDIAASYYDTLLDGAYIPYYEKEEEILENLIDMVLCSADEMEQSSYTEKIPYLIQYYLSAANIYIRCIPEYYSNALIYIDKAGKLLEENKNIYNKELCSYYMVMARYFTTAEPNPKQAVKYMLEAAKIATRVFPTDLEIIDIVYIPSADCLCELEMPEDAADIIEIALSKSLNYPDILMYKYKEAELKKILIDIYYECGNKEKCRELINEIDKLNETYKDYGIHIELDPGLRKIFS